MPGGWRSIPSWSQLLPLEKREQKVAKDAKKFWSAAVRRCIRCHMHNAQVD